MPNISLEELGGGAANSALTPGPHDPLIELFLRAIENPNGIRLTCPNAKAAMALRFRLYRARNKEVKRGNTAFNNIQVTLEDRTVTITQLPPFTIEEL